MERPKKEEAKSEGEEEKPSKSSPRELIWAAFLKALLFLRRGVLSANLRFEVLLSWRSPGDPGQERGGVAQ